MLPRPVGAGKAVARLGAVAFGCFAVLGCALALAGMLTERTLPSSTFAPFGGWQLNALAISLAIVLFALLIASVVALRRRYRRLRGRTPHRRAVVVAAFLPGAFLGGLAGNPMASVVSWVSLHTADASHARIEERQLLTEYGTAPPVHATGNAAPSGAIADRILQTSDLGPGWYSQQRPNPAEATTSTAAKRLGATEAVRMQLNQAHWTGAAWLPQHLLLENVLRFRSAQGARRYLADLVSEKITAPVAVTAGTTTAIVYEGDLRDAAWRSANFVVGADLFSLRISVDASGTPTATAFSALVTRTLHRATSGR